MSRTDLRWLLLPLLFLALPCITCAQGVETSQEWAYGDGIYQGRSLRLVQDEGAYVGGTLGEWHSGPTATRITGLFMGYKTDGDVSLDLSVGGYSELDPRSEHPLEAMLPQELGSMGKMAVAMSVNRNLRMSLGGLYLKADRGNTFRRSGDRFLGQARIDYRFY